MGGKTPRLSIRRSSWPLVAIVASIAAWWGAAARYVSRLDGDCAAGKATACYLLGSHVAVGRMDLWLGRDPVRAENLYRKGCALGDARSCVAVAARLKTPDPSVDQALGRSVLQNAYRNAGKECANGEGGSCLWLGRMNEAREKNLVEATRFYKLACDKGEQEGCRHLARLTRR